MHEELVLAALAEALALFGWAQGLRPGEVPARKEVMVGHKRSWGTSVRHSIDGGITRLAFRRVRRIVEGDVPLSDPTRDRLTALASRMLAPETTGRMHDSLRGAVISAFEALYQPTVEQDLPDPRTREVIVNHFHRLYYHDSRRTWRDTWYRGVPVLKCPLDLWLYQEIIHDVRPDLIIETGTAHGGSAYFLADLCDTVDHGQVVTIDINSPSDPPRHDRVTYLEGSSVAPGIVTQVKGLVPLGGTALVILDSDHSRDHVRQELESYAPMVSVGSYIIVEDTNVHGHPALPSFPAGPMEALQHFLSGTDAFEIDRRLEKFMMTFNPSGYLRRVRADFT
ncbi:MAG: CmcI family methyltransferase [Acidimicrobiales bacterium]